MKTAKFFLCFVAMGSLLMTGCKKDDEKDTPVAANDNEIVINNIRLPLESHIQTEGGVPRYMDCYQPAAEGEEREGQSVATLKGVRPLTEQAYLLFRREYHGVRSSVPRKGQGEEIAESVVEPAARRGKEHNSIIPQLCGFVNTMHGIGIVLFTRQPYDIAAVRRLDGT